MGLNFYYNNGLQPKMRAGIINEHECSTCQDSFLKASDIRTRLHTKFEFQVAHPIVNKTLATDQKMVIFISLTKTRTLKLADKKS